eukprot:1158966-Pelagomonas_calceolata.AAC.4
MWWHTHRHAHAQTNTRQVVTSAPCNFHCCRSSRLTARHHALLPHASSAPHSYTQGLDKQKVKGTGLEEVRQGVDAAGQGLVDLAVEAAEGMQTSVLHLADGGAPED